jgi:hypothetical protein
MPTGVHVEGVEYLTKIPYAEAMRKCQRLRDAFAARYKERLF